MEVARQQDNPRLASSRPVLEMPESKASGSRLVSPILRDIAWGEKYGAFDDRLGRSLLRAWHLGVADEQIEGMILQRVRRLRVQELFGQLEPFTEPRLSNGDLLIGRSSWGQEIRIPFQTLTAGTLIAARTGGGKSNLFRLIVPQIAADGARVWVTDQWKREARHLRSLFEKADLVVLRPEGMKYDPLHPGACDPRHHLPNVASVLTRRLGLGPRAQTVLYQVCDALYREYGILEGRTDAYPCLFDVWERVRATPGLNAPAREAILDRLGAVLIELEPYRLGWSAQDLARFNICFELSGASEPVKHILFEPLIYSVFQSEIDRGLVNAPLGLFLALDDAQAYAQQGTGGEMTPLDMGAGLFRSTGLGLCLNVQTMRGLSRKLVPNLSGLRIMGPMGTGDDYAGLGSDMGLSGEQIEWARRNTKPGVFIAKTDQWREPFVLHVPHVKLPRMVTDEEAAESVRALDELPTIRATEYEGWRPDHLIRIQISRDTDERETTNSRPANSSLRKDELDYLVSIANEPFSNVTDRDQALGLAKSKGNQLRKALIRKGLLNAVAINPGGRGRRFHLLELTKAGVEQLSEFGVSIPGGRGRGGLRHQFWASEVAGWLRGKELAPVIEDESRSVRVDVAVVTRRGSHVAIEVEMSPGHELDNIRKDLGAGFEEVVCLVQSPELARSLEARVLRELNQSEIPRVSVGCLKDYQALLDRFVS